MCICRLLVVVSLVYLANVSNIPGAICVSFGTHSNTILRENGSLVPAGSTMLVYWSADNSLDGYNEWDPLNPTGGDQLLNPSGWSTSDAISLPGRITGHAAETFGSGTTEYAGGYLYIAVFDFLYENFSGGFTGGMYYGLGPLYGPATQQYPTPNTPDNYGIGVTEIRMSTPALPEPGALAFVLMGAGVVMVSRKLRK